MQAVLHLPGGGCRSRVIFVFHDLLIRYVQCVYVCVCVDKIQSRHLDTDAALQFELQTDHVHLTGGAELFDLGHLLAHLIDGHLDGA